jgi:hypothetical protein
MSLSRQFSRSSYNGIPARCASRKCAQRQRRYARIMFAGLLGAGFTYASVPHAKAQGIELSFVNGSNGFRLNGEAVNDHSGRSVSGAGDVNGDGFADLIIGAPYVDSSGSNSGASYVVFGTATQTSSGLGLSALDGTNGFRVEGESAGNLSGRSVSGAGDVNNDGFDDLVIGASYAAPNGLIFGGACYIVFGKPSFGASLNLASLDGSNGIRLNGEAIYDVAGYSVSGAGDVNGDNFADIIVGAPSIDFVGDPSGRGYVIFGKASFTTSTIELSALSGSDGIKLNGVAVHDRCGKNVAAAGDINDDGFDDVIIGAPSADPHGNFSGASYVVFGKALFTTSVIELSALNGNDGIVLNGAAGGDYAGKSVSGAGDVNGDGFADLIVGAPYASSPAIYSGASYLVFGKASFTTSVIELSALDGTGGFKLSGEAAENYAGASVSGAGDVNNDGLDDLLVGAPSSNFNGTDSGASYLVFGKTSFTSGGLNLAALDGTNGFKINGGAEEEYSGKSVSGGGDLNGDSLADLIIGAPYASNGDQSGATYVVFGPSRLDISKLKVALNFAKPGKDSISVKGTLAIPAGFDPTGQQVSINVGGTTKVLTLDEKGKAKTAADSLAVKVKSKGGLVEAQDAKFTASFKKGDFDGFFTDEGLIDATLSKAPVDIGLLLSFSAGKLYNTAVPLLYTAKQGKTGKTK